jgi:hypothetical protein
MNLSDKLSLFSAEPTPQPPTFEPGSTAWMRIRSVRKELDGQIVKVEVVDRACEGAWWCVRREGEAATWHVTDLYASSEEATRAVLTERHKRITARLASLELQVREAHAEQSRLRNERKQILEELAALAEAEETL